MISFDTETTGVDLRHGAKPFAVTTCDEAGDTTFWLWDVDPLTREPIIPEGDLEQIIELIESEDELILQNPKFDAAAMAALGYNKWPWHKTKDTLLAGHLLASNENIDLTTMALVYLDVNIKPLEDRLKVAVIKARGMVGGKNPAFAGWFTARKGAPGMPSASDETWKYDYWLPRAVAKALDYPEPAPDCQHEWAGDECSHCKGHFWWLVLETYMTADSTVTLPLYQEQMARIERKQLKEIYELRLKVLPIAFKMESRGVTFNMERVDSLLDDYRDESGKYGRKCVSLAASYGFNLELPKSGGNSSLTEFLCGYQAMECPHCKTQYRESLYSPKKHCKECKVDNKGKKYKIEKPEEGKLVFLSKHMGLDLMTIARGAGEVPLTGKGASKAVAQSQLITEAGNLSFDKEAVPYYIQLFTDTEPRGKRLHFIKSLKKKRKFDTASGYLEAYKRFGKPWIPACPGAVDPLTGAGWYVLHPNLNPTGTDTLRWSSSNPNSQNISKQEAECEACDAEGCEECNYTGITLRSLRWCFCPAPGREYFSMDARGIEDRIPAYESGEQDLIAIFEKADEPPYYGSNHLLRFHTVYPDIWNDAIGKIWEWEGKHQGKKVTEELVGPYVKKKYNYTYYQWVKNGGFAVQYGAIDRADGRGTADRAFHKPGAHALLKRRFNKLEKLNQHYIQLANRFGYVETIPDKTCSHRGYPLQCTRTYNGGILPTVPLNYHVQGTAMWWMMKAMIRCQDYLDELNTACKRPGHYAIALQIHDELLFDFPCGRGEEPWKTNLAKADRLKSLMEEGGNDIGLPTPVSREYHSDSWAEGMSV